MQDKDLKQTEGSERHPDVLRVWQPGRLATWAQEGQGLRLRCDKGTALHISALGDDILRCRYSADGDFAPDFSYAIAEGAKALQASAFSVTEHDEHLSLQTGTLRCVLQKEGLRLRFETPDGHLLGEDAEGYTLSDSIMGGTNSVRLSRKAQEGEQYFGLGDKTCSLDLRGQYQSNWNTDAFAFGPGHKELYRSIPFFYGLHEGRAYGIFFDNSFRTHFDFDSAGQGEMWMSAEGGEMNYYFIQGPLLLDVARRYAQLSGLPELPPLWALGFHQCRWSYYPEARVRQLAQDFRDKQIPCDAIYLDIDYMDGYRCFTWNHAHFPKPAAMIAELAEAGFHTVVMIDPGLRSGDEYPVYVEGKAKDMFCKRPDGELMRGPVWPPNCVFPDFTNPRVRDWWGGLYEGLYLQDGVSGFWNDMNEPALFEVDSKTFPLDVRHDYDGHPCSHKKAHNVYGMQMSRATLAGLKRLRPDKRPFLLTRATYAGGQRFAAVWTGDNVATWEHVQLSNTQAQRMSVSGFSFVGCDIGGFADDPTGEMFVRWLQLGVFHPFFRVHTMGFNVDGGTAVDDQEAIQREHPELNKDQEPWSFGEPYTAWARAAINWRYRLLPLIYTAFQRYVSEGTPMIWPLSFYDQHDPQLRGIEREFVFGGQLLVSPVVQPQQTQQKVYLPKGLWYHFWNGSPVKGGQFDTVATPMEHIPIFVKGGTVLPLYPLRQYTGEKAVDVLELHAYFAEGEHHSSLYEDAGEGYAHEHGSYKQRRFALKGHRKSLHLEVTHTGEMPDSYATCVLVLHGLPFEPTTMRADGKTVAFERECLFEHTTYTLTLPHDFKTLACQ